MNIAACYIASSPPNINQPDEADAPLIYAAICAKCSDDGHPASSGHAWRHILDSDGSGKVVFDGITLNGGTEKQEEGEDCPSTNEAGNSKVYERGDVTYQFSGADLDEKGTLTVNHDGNSITIENWANGDLGITLTPHSPKDGEDCDDEPDNFASPLVLDLDGDGLELINLNQSVAFFDVDSDGGAERTGWVAPDDGILVYDRNGDGIINDATEMFGYGETFSSGPGEFAVGGESPLVGPNDLDINYTSGFDELALLDLNGDGVFDQLDTDFVRVNIWRDLNGNGTAEDGELFAPTRLRRHTTPPQLNRAHLPIAA